VLAKCVPSFRELRRVRQLAEETRPLDEPEQPRFGGLHSIKLPGRTGPSVRVSTESVIRISPAAHVR
jgi:hypothetical protein